MHLLKKYWRSLAFIVGGIIILAPLSMALFHKFKTPKKIDTEFVAHALGGLPGFTEATWMNCLECFHANYKKGFRYFEIDLKWTSDQILVAIHTLNQMDLAEGFSHEDFLKAKVKEKYTGVDIFRLVNLMKEFKDWYLIVDSKGDVRPILVELCQKLAKEQISCKERVIPQLYAADEISIVDDLDLDRAILTLYRNSFSAESIAEILRKQPKIVAITMSRERALNNKFLQQILGLNIPVFVHPINDWDTFNKLKSRGVSGVYSSFLFR